jgi:pimeloyl-ACP methyl ester carboxylesterase
MEKIAKRSLLLLAIAALIGPIASVATFVYKKKAAAYQTEDRWVASPGSGAFVDAGDTQVFVQRLGKKDGPAVVFIHGTGSWSETWRPSMEAATKLGYHAVAIDMPPFGFSLPPASGDYSKPTQAKRLIAALDGMGIGRAKFVAHSFGAAPVMEALMTDPERVESLVLVDAALGLDGPQRDGSDNTIQRVLRNKWLSESISAVFLTNPDFTEKLLQSFITEKEKATSHWVNLYQKPLSVSGSYQSVALWLPELFADRGKFRSDDTGAYAQIRFPVTLIWGETDDITPLSQATSLQGTIPGARLIRIPKAGHIPQIEEPAAFHSALSDALGKAMPNR